MAIEGAGRWDGERDMGVGRDSVRVRLDIYVGLDVEELQEISCDDEPAIRSITKKNLLKEEEQSMEAQ